MGILLAFLMLSAPPARAELRPDKVYVAEGKKAQTYVRDGLIIGGDKAIDGVVVKDIRRAANAGFERIVIDLVGSKAGEPAAIDRPPYYQISANPDEKRVVITVFGKPRLEFDAKKVLADFKKSTLVNQVTLYPKLDENSWTFAFELNAGNPIEVFELANPVRIILDIKRAR